MPRFMICITFISSNNQQITEISGYSMLNSYENIFLYAKAISTKPSAQFQTLYQRSIALNMEKLKISVYLSCLVRYIFRYPAGTGPAKMVFDCR